MALIAIIEFSKRPHKKGNNLKNIGYRVMGPVDNNVDFHGEYIFQVGISSSIKVMHQSAYFV